ncbi:hypothetical protein [Pseudoalteromonas phage XCL1123]|nr:hypothetical protein [Pseudoalteromonas phage XCL1123]
MKNKIEEVKAKFNLSDSDLIEITSTLSAAFELSASAAGDSLKGVKKGKLESLVEYMETSQRKGLTSSNVRKVRDGIKNKVAFNSFSNVTRYVRKSLPGLEAAGLIYDIDGDNFKIKPFTTKNN